MARLARLDGPAAGQAHPLSRTFITIGRHPGSDLRLDDPPDQDVSARHAALIRDEQGWLIRDLDSATGTWVDGVRIRSDHRLGNGALIRLGEHGPTFRLEAGEPAARFGGRGRLARNLLLSGTLIAAGWLGLQAIRTPSALARERQALVARLDSVTAALTLARAREGALATALTAARIEAARTRDSVRAGEGDRIGLDALTRQVDRMTSRHQPLLRAAAFDLDGVVAGNTDAVGLVVAERADLTTVSGTGFVVASRGDTSWVITSRHLVVDASGAPVRRLGIIFNGTAQNFRATTVRMHATLDLALLRVMVRGGTAAVRGLADSASAGTPVASLTFPLGLDLAASGDWRRAGVTASAFIATVTQAEPDRLQLDGYGVEGMSGSPLFNADGVVVGVIYGGAADSGGRIVFAVPGARVRELLTGREE